ncbi:COG1361 S-layer family protein [Halobellus marinus]|uniref:COG1361 S-layer family protein n=1 Tax=Halobellus TaxID=1073986 RepID=UPI0028AC07CE|nr:COG1361 S-layer family protein [Halobellus sp. DFY28]
MKRPLLVAVVVLSLLVSPVPVAGLTSNPDLRTVTADRTLTPGSVNQVSFQLVNDPDGPDDKVRTATSVRVRPGNTGPLKVETSELFVSKLADGDPADLSIQVDVPKNVESGTYRIPLYLTYEYDNGAANTVERRVTEHLRVRIESGPRFTVVDTDSTAAVNGQGTLEVTMQNIGDRESVDSTLTLSSSSPDVTLGSDRSSTRFVDAWPEGENRTFVFDTRVSDAAQPANYSLTAQVDYERPDGTTGSSPGITVPFRALPEMTFTISDVDSSLRVGETNTLSGTVTNTGPKVAEDAVVTVTDPGPTITPIESSVAVGSLDPGESAEFAFEVDVTSSTEAGPRQFQLFVDYWDQEGATRQSDVLPTRAEVRPESSVFDVEPVDGTVAAGSGGEFRVTVTNTREYAVTDVSAKIYADSPLSTADDRAFIERLDPGESREIVFELSADSDATAKTNSVKMDFQYEDADGETIVSDTHRAAVTVIESTDDTNLPLIGGVLVLLIGTVAGVSLWKLRRS